jgi:anti-sigma B factor antagonist
LRIEGCAVPARLPDIPAQDPTSTETPGLEQILTVTSALTAEGVIVTVAGEVDLLTAGRLRNALVDALQRPVGHPVVVDMTRVTYFGSSGLAALVAASDEGQRHREALNIVVSQQGMISRVLRLTGLDRVLALYETVDEALHAR